MFIVALEFVLNGVTTRKPLDTLVHLKLDFNFSKTFAFEELDGFKLQSHIKKSI